MKPTFIFGSPRSGTTWLARIFDSRADTLYRHEPDTTNPGSVPFVFGPGETDEHIAATRDYAQILVNDRSLRCNGLLPQFEKSYRSALGHRLHLGMIYAGRFLEKLLPMVRLDRKLMIPDLVRRGATCHTVVKSVDSIGRLPLFAQAVDDCNLILLIRHPCGVVASGLRGQSLGKMAPAIAYHSWLKLEAAQRRGLTAEKLDAMPQVDVLATSWLLFNEYCLEAVQHDPRFKVVVYDDLCENPIDGVQSIFEHCGFQDSAETRKFLEACMSNTDADPKYFQVLRNPSAAASRWKQELSDEDKQRIFELTRDSLPGKLFYS